VIRQAILNKQRTLSSQSVLCASASHCAVGRPHGNQRLFNIAVHCGKGFSHGGEPFGLAQPLLLAPFTPVQ